jgi:colanic acid/amylovoran biosynthesis protein
MKFAVSGVTLQGNLGGVAMLLTARQEFARRFPGAEFLLLSITPQPDRAGQALPGVKVVWAHWFTLICLFMPLSLLTAPFNRQAWMRRLLGRIPYFQALIECEAVIDLSGIAFVDGRGPALLAYNAACCVPALFLGRPVLKLAQSLGPFRQPLNRTVARAVIRRCAFVAARGEASARELTNLLDRPALALPDTTFCLQVPAELTHWAVEEFRRVGLGPAPIVISPSLVFELDCARHGIDFATICANLIRTLRMQGLPLALLAHSKAGGIAKNDDPAVCTRILALLSPELQPPVLVATDPLQARALIGRAGLFIGSRYHALVSAYAGAVPSLALSWNEKYADLARLFDCTHQVIPTAEINTELLTARVLALQDMAPQVAEQLRRRLPFVRVAAAENFRHAEHLLGAASTPCPR